MIANRHPQPRSAHRSAGTERLREAISDDHSAVDSEADDRSNLYFAFRNLCVGRLTHMEAEIASLLYRRAQVSKEALLAATHDPSKGDDERTVDIVKVHISAIRRKLAPTGVMIETIRPGFYRFDAQAKARLRQLLGAAEA
jgi:DNA-binding response OmpR family regulator